MRGCGGRIVQGLHTFIALRYRSESARLPKMGDSPYTELQVFDIAEIQDQVPIIMSMWMGECVLPSYQYIA